MKKIVIIFFLMIISFSTINIDITVASTIDNLSCKSYVLVDTKTGKIIEGLNYNDRVEVASICKLMTVYITLNYIEKSNVELDTKIFASPYATSMEGSSAYLDNQEYSLDDLLKSVIVASANDSAVVLAEYVAGNEIEFVKLMNTTAKELGMFDTKYSNATGLSALEQYSTAHDTAILINELYKNELYLQYSTIWMDMITHLSGRQTSLVNTNRLIKYYNNVLCGKTGFTDEAGYCLASIATNNDITLTCVVLGCKNKQDRFNDSVNIFEEAFSDYYSEVLLDKSMPINNNIKVNKGTKNV
ncbi:MAG: D-alanyl-D-alanine carboxypeptidase, partial [Clostridia bacterium]|nr:D-alanyl-D-alanine carboxypeptidase [Clostridia bacterium]